MASLFIPPSKPPKQKFPPKDNTEQMKARINRERRRSSGSYASTIVGSGLKTSTGA